MNGILKMVFGKRGPYDNLLMYMKSPVNRDFSMEGELTDEISKTKVRITSTQHKEIPIALSHSKIIFLCEASFFKIVFVL